MNDGYAWWLSIVGIAIGIALAWLVAGRLRRHEGDVDEDERRAEAEWISETIEASGASAPAPLVERVLELHAEYLESGTALDPVSMEGDPVREPRTWAPRPGTDQPGSGPVGS
jgi:hypothetical protein